MSKTIINETAQYKKSQPTPKRLADTALAARPSAAELTWEFQPERVRQAAVALYLSPSEIIGGYTAFRTDALMPVADGLVAEFIRQYSSLDLFPGMMGRGWSHVTPSLIFRRVAVPDNPRSYYTQAVLTVGMQPTRFTLNADGFFRPEDHTSPYMVLGLAGDNPFAPRGVPNLTLIPRL